VEVSGYRKENIKMVYEVYRKFKHGSSAFLFSGESMKDAEQAWETLKSVVVWGRNKSIIWDAPSSNSVIVKGYIS